MTLPPQAILLGLVSVLALSACGGKTQKATYDGDVFESCLQEGGGDTAQLRYLFTGPTAAAFGKHLPGAVVAEFADGEFVIFAISSDHYWANQGAKWATARPDGKVNGTASGNLVVVTRSHPTAKIVKLIDQCRDDAVQT